jgi:uncharacterized membrane protein (DUF485 family)
MVNDMVFWLFVIALIVGVICYVVGQWMYRNTRYDTEWLSVIGAVIAGLATILIIFGIGFIIAGHADTEAYIASSNQRYESLVYQLENDLYDNDNDLGKKELYNEIREWNEDLAYYQQAQDSFWLGIFYPNIFDQFKFIEYNT